MHNWHDTVACRRPEHVRAFARQLRASQLWERFLAQRLEATASAPGSLAADLFEQRLRVYVEQRERHKALKALSKSQDDLLAAASGGATGGKGRLGGRGRHRHTSSDDTASQQQQQQQHHLPGKDTSFRHISIPTGACGYDGRHA